MNNPMHRPLSPEETAILQQQGCTADNWDTIYVAKGFLPETVHNCHFGGEVRLGVFRTPAEYPGGIRKPAGIYQATIYDSTIGDDCRISHIADFIAHCRIAPGALIEHVDRIYVEGDTAFGNGTAASVLKENGGREVILYEELTAQAAYLQCFYRHDEELQKALAQIASASVAKHRSTHARIGMQARITHCGTLCNVSVGNHCTIEGAVSLREGTLVGDMQAPAHIGQGVQADGFILLRGAHVGSGAQLTRCFVGECSIIGHGFTATDTIAFANCQLECGEACSLFAGPYTVSHHKSTLLIGIYTSFFNAGSGSNQSNHAYKLGPVHYGILERGCRTGSNSYLLWPSRIGIFSTVIGEVKMHLDLRNLPFSYIIGEAGKTYIAPGASLRSIGTWRDAEKWPKRDGRKNWTNTADIIHQEAFSPLAASRLIAGLHTLDEIRTAQGPDAEVYTYQGAFIRPSSLKNGIRLYNAALKYILGNLISSDEKAIFVERNFAADTPVESIGFGKVMEHFYWVDVAGMQMTEAALEEILNGLRYGSLANAEALTEVFRAADRTSAESARLSISSMQAALVGERITTIPLYIKALEAWQKSTEELLGEVLADAEKEFSPLMQITSGIDSRYAESLQRDFIASGASAKEFPFLAALRQKVQQVKERVEHLKSR